MIKPRVEVKTEEWMVNQPLSKQKMKEELRPPLTRTQKRKLQ